MGKRLFETDPVRTQLICQPGHAAVDRCPDAVQRISRCVRKLKEKIIVGPHVSEGAGTINGISQYPVRERRKRTITARHIHG